MIRSKKHYVNILLKILLFSIVVAGVIYTLFWVDTDAVRAKILENGRFSFLFYILAWAILPCFFFPVGPLALTGGFGFGFFRGSLYTFIGASINILVMFLLSRYLLRDTISELLENKYPKVFNLLYKNSKRLLPFLAILRLIPLVPYEGINYVFGLSDINIINYYLISIITIIPGTLVFVNIGAQSTNIWSLEFWGAIVMLLLLIGVTSFFGRNLKWP